MKHFATNLILYLSNISCNLNLFLKIFLSLFVDFNYSFIVSFPLCDFGGHITYEKINDSFHLSSLKSVKKTSFK